MASVQTFEELGERYEEFKEASVQSSRENASVSRSYDVFSQLESAAEDENSLYSLDKGPHDMGEITGTVLGLESLGIVNSNHEKEGRVVDFETGENYQQFADIIERPVESLEADKDQLVEDIDTLTGDTFAVLAAYSNGTGVQYTDLGISTEAVLDERDTLLEAGLLEGPTIRQNMDDTYDVTPRGYEWINFALDE